jgi:glycosyltransferase involved in cell wall biosynthesis
VFPFIDWHFDATYYLRKYPDAAASVENARTHYDRIGAHQGRVPHHGLDAIDAALRQRALLSRSPLKDIVRLFPASRRRSLVNAHVWRTLKEAIHPGLYFSQTGNEQHLVLEEVFAHFLSQGAFEGLRPCLFFNEGWYRETLERMRHSGAPYLPSSGPLFDRGVNPFLHWITLGVEHRIVPTPLFDEAYYLSRNPTLERWPGWVFLHYLKHGCFEANRRPSTYVDKVASADPTAKASRNPLLLAHVFGAQSPWSNLRPMNPAVLGIQTDPVTGFPLEQAAAHVVRKTQKLESAVYRELIAKAAQIEPLVLRPHSPRDISWLPIKHDVVDLAECAEALRRDIGLEEVDTLVLAPHCRMAGSARVAGELLHAISEVGPQENVLLLTTDLPDFERPEWFPDNIRVFDVSRYADGLPHEKRIRLLLDVARGLAPIRIVNVNSRLGWELFRDFGPQLAQATDLFCYLFTWDLDEHGNKGGYPITFFQSCFTFLTGVFIDNAVLRDELIDRYAMSAQLRARLHLLYTPAPAAAVDYSENFERRRTQGRGLRVFWSGRFDRQKRFDLVVEIAKRRPDIEILAWGKAVLGGSGVDFDSLPTNIRLQGTYREFDELPVASCDFLLYTSQWDGLPTILIDAAARGVPILASAVGGVVDLIDDATGFPVVDASDADAYVAAIEAMVADPAAVTARTGHLRRRVMERCSRDRYIQTLETALALSPFPTGRTLAPSALCSVSDQQRDEHLIDAVRLRP